MTCPSQGQIDPDGIHGLMCRWCRCCPAHQALSALDKSKNVIIPTRICVGWLSYIWSSYWTTPPASGNDKSKVAWEEKFKVYYNSFRTDSSTNTGYEHDLNPSLSCLIYSQWIELRWSAHTHRYTLSLSLYIPANNSHFWLVNWSRHGKKLHSCLGLVLFQ